MRMILSLAQQLRRPITWGTALSSLGLAVLAGSAITTSTAGPPNPNQAGKQRRAVIQVSAADDDEDDDLDDEDESAGKVSLSAIDPDDDMDEPAGKVSISGRQPPHNESTANEAAPGAVKLKDHALPKPPNSTWGRTARKTRTIAVRKVPKSRCVVPIDQRPSIAPSVAAVEPVQQTRHAQSIQPLEGALAGNVLESPASGRVPQQSSATLTTPDHEAAAAVAAIDELIPDEAPPEMLVEKSGEAGDEASEDTAIAGITNDAQSPGETANDAEEEEPAFVSLTDKVAQSAGVDCPPQDSRLDSMVNRIEDDQAERDEFEAEKQRRLAAGEDVGNLRFRKPIGKLRADMQMRLPNSHSVFWKPADDSAEAQRAATRDRVLIHEDVRCRLVEAERQEIRRHFRQAYGPYFDRSSGNLYDPNLSPLFPYTYYPLYFEDPNLERCGHSLGCCVQPFASAVHFYGNVALFPVKALILCPWECVYPQADCAPCTRYSCRDNLLGPYPETTGWGCFRQRGYGRSW